MSFKPFLRDQPGEPLLLKLQIAAKKKKLSPLSSVERLIGLGELGILCRSLQDYSEAQDYFERAIVLAQELNDPLRLAANQVRLGVVQHHSEQWQDAENNFNAVLQDSRLEFQAYHDFAWQHLGKLKAEQGQLDVAKQFFEKALALRLQKQDPALIQSTQVAVDGIKALINQKNLGDASSNQ